MEHFEGLLLMVCNLHPFCAYRVKIRFGTSRGLFPGYFDTAKQ